MSQGQTIKDELITDNMGRGAEDVKPSNGGWTPPGDNPFVPSTTYIQIILGDGAIELSQVGVSGSVKTYTISFSTDLINYETLPTTFEGDATFLNSVSVRSIRIYPMTLLPGQSQLNVTIELYACFLGEATTQPGTTTQPSTTTAPGTTTQPPTTTAQRFTTQPPTTTEADSALQILSPYKLAARNTTQHLHYCTKIHGAQQATYN
ncbi:PREDICTED: mucin-13-like [Priapulus caudatus]|uniref:Mucin-13-like n=1 Tax=Priapulus caudatus TaxID=37621 RepID=A0ABM1E8X7_PRICU|nr:PREDICTED: mucin-13-like [Priapulus caudatus]